MIIRDHQDGYIGWDEHERSQQQLTLNNYARSGGTKSGCGGKALLSGILTCGGCGRRLGVAGTGNPQSPPGLSLRQAKPDDGLISMHVVRRPASRGGGSGRDVARGGADSDRGDV